MVRINGYFLKWLYRKRADNDIDMAHNGHWQKRAGDQRKEELNDEKKRVIMGFSCANILILY